MTTDNTEPAHDRRHIWINMDNRPIFCGKRGCGVLMIDDASRRPCAGEEIASGARFITPASPARTETAVNWMVAEVKSSFWHAWRFWRPMYIATGVVLACLALLVLADLTLRALP